MRGWAPQKRQRGCLDIAIKKMLGQPGKISFRALFLEGTCDLLPHLGALRIDGKFKGCRFLSNRLDRKFCLFHSPPGRTPDSRMPRP